MKRKVWRDADGAVVNIGDWDEQIAERDDGQGGTVKSVGNPIPEGVTCTTETVTRREDGGLAAEGDFGSLRRAAYPPLRDQLDAMWKGGEAAEAMREQIAAVKARFPK